MKVAVTLLSLILPLTASANPLSETVSSLDSQLQSKGVAVLCVYSSFDRFLAASQKLNEILAALKTDITVSQPSITSGSSGNICVTLTRK